MALPSTDISMSMIYSEANGSTPGSALSFKTLCSASYFEGPNGNNAYSFNTWGQGTATGLNRINGLNYSPSNFNFGQFRTLQYFYDQSTWQCRLRVINNLGASQFFPPPPIDNTVQDVNLTLYDNTQTYSYLNTNSGAVISLGDGGGNYGPTDGSQATTPLIYNGFWEITVASGPNFPGATANLSINGASYFTGQAVNGGGTPTVFNFNTWGYPTLDATNSGFLFVLEIY